MARPEVVLLSQRLQFLRSISATKETWHKVEEWCSGTRPIIAAGFPLHLGDFDDAKKMEWVRVVGVMTDDFSGGHDNRIRTKNDQIAQQAKSRLVAVVEAILKLVEIEERKIKEEAVAAERGELKAKRAAAKAAPASPSPDPQLQQSTSMIPKNNKVFVVHGHDDGMLHSVARVLEVQGLEAVILNEQENEGQTIIEKFEKHADVQYAVVLLSGDDTAYLTKLGPKEGVKVAKPRARQNVVLELGYFVGRLGRPRVTVLQKGELEVPSDISGVVYVAFDGHGGWELKMCKELRAAGYTIDLNKL